MPELPQVEAVRLTLSPILEDKRISSLKVHWQKSVASPAPHIFCALVANQRIEVLCRRGKYLIIKLSSGDRIAIHLRMTGELRYFPTYQNTQSAPERKYLRALFRFTDGSALAFFDIRKFGRIALLKPEEWVEFKNRLGIEPMDPAFTDHVFYQILQGYRRQIKALLLDQRVIAGLGNIYIDEALFLAQIHPRAISNTIDKHLARRLRKIIVGTLQLAIKNRGTTFSNYRSGLGDTGTNQSSLQIYGKKAETPCIRCGTPLQRTVVAQRGTVYCPSCQREPASS